MSFDRSGKARYLLLALGVFVADQWSKWWIEEHFTRHEIRGILPGLNLTRVENTGVAFGLFASGGSTLGTVILTVLGLLALAVVGFYFHRAAENERRLLASLGLILGGAVGNLTDRVMAGAVTDFIDCYVGTYHWHTFNVADSAITIGILLMILDMFPGRGARKSAESATSPTLEGERSTDG
jgi:signal peptidase II